MAKSYPEWKVRIWRAIRAAVAAGIASTIAVKPDLSDPRKTVQILAVAFSTGVLTWAGKYIRDRWGEADKSAGVLNKLIL